MRLEIVPLNVALYICFEWEKIHLATEKVIQEHCEKQRRLLLHNNKFGRFGIDSATIKKITGGVKVFNPANLIPPKNAYITYKFGIKKLNFR
jgi:hypothetical protein